MFHSIQWRMTVPILIIILGSMGILGGYLVNFIRDTENDNLRTLLVTEARLAAEASIPGFAEADPEVALNDISQAGQPDRFPDYHHQL